MAEYKIGGGSLTVKIDKGIRFSLGFEGFNDKEEMWIGVLLEKDNKFIKELEALDLPKDECVPIKWFVFDQSYGCLCKRRRIADCVNKIFRIRKLNYIAINDYKTEEVVIRRYR